MDCFPPRMPDSLSYTISCGLQVLPVFCYLSDDKSICVNFSNKIQDNFIFDIPNIQIMIIFGIEIYSHSW